jgi:hypothetical protein
VSSVKNKNSNNDDNNNYNDYIVNSSDVNDNDYDSMSTHSTPLLSYTTLH